MSEEQLTGVIWITANKKRIDLANMSDEHICNCIKFIIDHYPFRREFLPKLGDELILRGVGRYL
jgi:hypothetical protein